MHGKLIDMLALPALPWLLAQGRSVDRKTPRLPPAAGGPTGLVPGNGPPLRLLAVGESTAAGVGVEHLEQAVVGRFAHALNARSGRAIAWEAAGLSGATVREGHASLLPGIAQAPRDLILILFGANDTLARHSAREFVRDLTRLIDALRERAGDAPVLISSVPPLHTFPAIPRPLNTYLGARARWLDDAAARIKLPGVWHAPVDLNMEPLLFAEDGFHPGVLGYQAWGASLAASAFKYGLVPEAS